MPVKWTPENDQMLLLKILETHELNVDAKRVSAAWPTDQGELPTARAITERLVKIRQNAKTHFAISSSQSKASNTSTTPRKPKATAPSTPHKTGSASKTASASATAAPRIKQELSTSAGTPTKRKTMQHHDDNDDSDDDCVFFGAAPAPNLRKAALTPVVVTANGQASFGGGSLFSGSMSRLSVDPHARIESDLPSPPKRARQGIVKTEKGVENEGEENDTEGGHEYDDDDDVV